jgi:hypothetical protein
MELLRATIARPTHPHIANQFAKRGRTPMDDLKTFHLFLEPTRTHIGKALDKVSGVFRKCDPHDPYNVTLVDVDDLRYLALALERTLDMLNRAALLLNMEARE